MVSDLGAGAAAPRARGRRRAPVPARPEDDSTNGELYFALGQAEWRQRALDPAIAAFEAALTYAPGLRPEVEPYLTKAWSLQGGPQTAVIDFPPGSTRIEVAV